MADEKSASGNDVHYAPKCCVDGCDKWGIAGFAASKNVEPRWWCWEHYPHKHASHEQKEAAAIAASLGGTPQ